MKKLCKITLVLIIAFFATANLIQAQSIAFGAGVSGVENFPIFTMNYGGALIIPFNEKFSCEISYYHWQGEDHNYQVLKEDNLLGPFNLFLGNSGLNLTISCKCYSKGRSSVFLGAGLGRYEYIKILETSSSLDVESLYIGTYALVTKYQYRLSSSLSMYAKVITNTPTLSDPADWGFLNLGMEIAPWKF